MKNDFQNVIDLVGLVSKDNLRYVDYYAEAGFGIFMPTVGFCEYAITKAHTHPAYSFIIYFDYSKGIVPCNVDIKEGEYLVQAISPDFPHEEEEGDRFNRYIAIFISKDFYEKEYKHYSNSRAMYMFNSFTVSKNIMLHIEKYINEYEAFTPARGDMLVHISSIIVHELIRGVLKLKSKDEVSIKRVEIEKIVNYMHQYFCEKITISKLAALCNMSESGFNKVFKEELLTSPMDYLINIRIEKAKKLLRSRSKSITEIALECGFNSLSHFSSCFTKNTSTTPREYINTYK
ncbi:helix-turn-helix domain-containing protein [Clostridium cylindrosporum]|uniref:Transcriptional regulator, AraC family n=1 Tax=Clostridium cylindrosporum DSM 605 TaxID=1121307 RepID=A0A0J8D8H0_CLOCY|nr:AraC family transcriptional regulator [Clostridium cylindrosporum]KMT22355.1 transcriptional regulator, AraC family [Clostridium cylindrosporum DSM 605]